MRLPETGSSQYRLCLPKGLNREPNEHADYNSAALHPKLEQLFFCLPCDSDGFVASVRALQCAEKVNQGKHFFIVTYQMSTQRFS